MSDKKEQILAQLRSRYESKYGSNDALKQVITSELSKISKKKKINFEDLSELESKISSASKTASLLTTSHESTLPNNFLSPKIRNKINQLEKIRSIENSPVREHHNSTNPSSDDKSPTSTLKPSVNASLSNIVLPPISPTYLTPMELKILKSHTNNALKNSRFLLDDSIEENNESSLAVSRSTNLSPIRKDQSPVFRMPAGQKGQEREKALSQNIWKKINDHNLKRAEEEENQKAEKLRNKKQEWLQNLQKQISDKKDKASTLKNKDMIWSQKSIEIDLQRKVDEEEKEKMHKRKMRSLERENFAEMFNEKDELKKRLAEQKEKEAQQALYENEAYSEKKKVFEENNKRKKKQLNEILEEDLNNKISQTKEKTTKNKEDDERMNRNIIEKLEQDQGKSEEFLRALKERARRMPDAELSKVKGYDNLRQYGQIGANEDNNQGLMKFLYADRHNEQARTQKKMVNQSVLQKSYDHQRSIRVEKVKEYKNYIAEQKDLWKKEEEDMNAREELTTKVTKLKRQAQKEELDAQREMDAPLKVQTVSQNEAWVNKSTLKELQVIPEKNYGKMPYLKGF